MVHPGAAEASTQPLRTDRFGAPAANRLNQLVTDAAIVRVTPAGLWAGDRGR